MGSTGAYVDDSFMLPFLLGPCVLPDHPPTLWGAYTLREGGMPFHDGVGINYEKDTTTETQEQMSSIRSKWCMLDDCTCIIKFDMITLP